MAESGQIAPRDGVHIHTSIVRREHLFYKGFRVTIRSHVLLEGVIWLDARPTRAVGVS